MSSSPGPSLSSGSRPTEGLNSFVLPHHEHELSGYKLLNHTRGGFGVVYKALPKTNYLAIKAIDYKTFSGDLKKQLLREVSVLRGIKHRNIVHVHEINPGKDTLYIVMEYLRWDLLSYMKDHGKFTDESTSLIIRQVCNALNYCHERKICHRDLKPSNILYDEQSEIVKLTDFGFAKPKRDLKTRFTMKSDYDYDNILFEAAKSVVSYQPVSHTYFLSVDDDWTVAGTPRYIAPEIKRRVSYSGFKADVYSLGYVAYDLLIYPNNPSQREFSKLSENSRRFINNSLVSNPEDRLKVSELLKQDWIKSSDPSIELGRNSRNRNLSIFRFFKNQINNHFYK